MQKRYRRKECDVESSLGPIAYHTSKKIRDRHVLGSLSKKVAGTPAYSSLLRHVLGSLSKKVAGTPAYSSLLRFSQLDHVSLRHRQFVVSTENR